MNSLVIYLRNAILGGQITGAQLETLMANTAYRGAWTVAVNTRAIMRMFAQTSIAWPIIKTSVTACRIMAMSAIAMTEITGSPVAMTAFNVQRQVFTASGTWTKPATLLGIAVVALGGGGAGASRGGGNYGTNYGGSGGAMVSRILDPSTITGNVTVTVGLGGTGPASGSYTTGPSGGASSFGAYLTAAGGTGGPSMSNNSPATWSGAFPVATGSPTQGRVWPLLPFYAQPSDPANAMWSCDFNIIGQPGQRTTAQQTDYSADGVAWGTSYSLGAGGLGYCAGAIQRNDGTTTTGFSAPANSGGGGQAGSGTPSAGGSGGSGMVVVYWMS